MAVGHTIALACALGATVLLLTASVVGPPRASTLAIRPTLITLLVGTVLIEAYIIGYTIAVEQGGQEARERTRFPDLVRKCPLFTSPDGDGRCVVGHNTDTIVPSIHATDSTRPDVKFRMASGSFVDAPNGQVIASGLMHERAPGMSVRPPPTSVGDTRVACCRANAMPYTELSTLCPRSDILDCSELDGQASTARDRRA